MKKILLFILAVIVLMFAYSEYKEHQRFHPNNANIPVSNTIDLNYHNPEIVSNYYNALEAANNFMQMQWSANQIDVRSPEKVNEETTYAVLEYGKKVAIINLYKAILERSKGLKADGLTNDDIKIFETKGLSIEDYKKVELALKQ
ncbi:MAG: hypothetical protein QNK89_07295 [Lacinutrix sp.]|uniref:hypothetical protein n=1 Tax=Lacinutrix sp. TaxID=1937692 RepID=UPI0030B66E0F